jgi:hypothetical protein
MDGKWSNTCPTRIGQGRPSSVGEFGSSPISGTGPIRIDFSFPKAGLQSGGRSDWKFILQLVANVPIYNVAIYVLLSIPASRITGRK